jgi:quinoprotein dehydrogenase-associated probable ABC transporter substrate-binding protein
MSFRSHSTLLLLAAIPAFAGGRVFRVCADPNNLPFSNERGEGFENRLAEMIARDLNAKLEYTWWQERRGYVRNTLNADQCDAIFGIPAGVDSALLTKPYYQSTYVFVSRKDRGPAISSLFDQRLQHLRIGVHLTGDDYAPPVHALADRGIATNLVGYSMFGAYGEQNPPARLIEAVAHGDVDIAIAWGPFAGYFGRDLRVIPVQPPAAGPVPFTYEMSMAVRKGNDELKNELDAVLARRCRAIRALLVEYNVPLVGMGEEKSTCEPSRVSSASSR